MASEASAGYVGQGVLRREDDALLRGKGRFVDDLPEPKGTIHLAFLMSPYAHARILSVDAAAALALPGVMAVLTGDDLAEMVKPILTEINHRTYRAVGRNVIARDKVRFVGEHVAVVLAETPYIAQDGIELVDVRYEILPSVADAEEAAGASAPLVHDEVPNNVFMFDEIDTKDFKKGFDEGEIVISERFKINRIAGIPLEPRGCLALCEHTAKNITLYTSTQIPHLVRTALSRYLDYPESNIRVVAPDVGGGFGTKAQMYPEDLVATALALRYGRPVKWIQDRREDILTNIHARDHLYDMELSATPDGLIKGLRVRMYSNAGAYSSFPFGCAMEVIGPRRYLPGPYKIENTSFKTYGVATNTAPTGAFRGVGAPGTFLAMEGMIDRLARKLGLDPVEVRRRNTISPDDLPYTNSAGSRIDSGSFMEALLLAKEKIGYDDFRASQPADRLVNGRYRGLGICHFSEGSGFSTAAWKARGLVGVPGIASALIRVEPTGKIIAYVSHASSGQGHFTSFAQLVAEKMCAPLSDVTIVEGDTATVPYGSGTFASRGTITGGGAIIRAAAPVSAKIKRIAAYLLNSDPGDVVLKDGRAMLKDRPETSLSFQDIAKTAYSFGDNGFPQGEELGLEATAFYEPPMATVGNAVHMAIVNVDPGSGCTEIEKYIIVHDNGITINPILVDGQAQGGAAQGIGGALMEEVVYDSDGQLLSGNLLDYLLPTALDVPDISMTHLESPSPSTEGGFKGMGEGGVIGGLAVITNAVADALAGIGVNVNRVPLRPSFVSRLIHEKLRA